jgi:hypothetical protein
VGGEEFSLYALLMIWRRKICRNGCSLMWGDFLSFYSRFYEVIILKGTYAIGEGKMQNVSLDIKLRLYLKTNSLFPMHHLWIELINIFSKFKLSKSYNFVLNCHPPKPTSKDLTMCSTSQQTFSHSKHCSHHICYPNLACIGSLEG